MKNIQELLRQRLSAGVLHIIVRIGEMAEEGGFPAYLVGGCVRDILLASGRSHGLNRGNLDLDIVIEGDIVSLGKLLEQKLRLNVQVYHRFATAKVQLSDGFVIDIASAREELYPRPAVLPVVNASVIDNDLSRRDFTINTLAVKINKTGFGELLDLFRAEKDLQNKQIRVLHDKSFIDDPTRIFRAVRFEQRLGFTIEKHTEGLIRQAKKLGVPQQLTRFRIGNEIIVILKEKDPLKSLLRIDSLLGLRIIHPDIKLDETAIRQLQCCRRSIDDFKKELPGVPLEDWLIYFMVLTRRLTLPQIKTLCRDFSLTKNQTEKISSAKENFRAVLKIINQQKTVSRVQIYQILSALSYEEIIFLLSLLKTKRAQDRIHLFLYKFSRLKIRLRGGDLQKLGIKPGPKYKEILQMVLYAVLEGRLKSKADEVRYVKQLTGQASRGERAPVQASRKGKVKWDRNASKG